MRRLLAAALALLLAAGAAAAEMEIVVDVERMQLYLFEGEREVRRYPVATGAAATPTPLGVFRINRRFSGMMGGFGTCFLGLDVPWGNYGIHGTNKPESIGHAASHGCIRMHVPDAEELYALVPDGTRVVILCGFCGDVGASLRPLRPGDRSSMVRAVQSRLRALGWYHGQPDGVYGDATARAVAEARSALGLPPGDVDWAFYQAVGLVMFE